MQARYIEANDRADLYAFVNTVSTKDSRAIDYFFKTLLSSEVILVEYQGLIKCLISFDERILNMAGHKIKVAYINELLIDPKLNQDQALDLITDLLADKYLLTISHHEKLGNNFIEIANKYQYEILRKQLYNVNGYSISDEFLDYELMDVYNAYISKFDVYFDLAKNVSLTDLLEDYEVFATRDINEEIKGFIVYNYSEGIMHVRSLVYTDALSLLTLLNQAMGMNDKIIVQVALFENFELVVDNLKGQIKALTSICVNDEILFKRLFNHKYSSITEMLESSGKSYYFL
ncbi:MAG: hypothetical protein GX074_04490 [Erysipelothrix sp.]|nr:hypothetical protein [Erysipelothrix sp.]